MPVEQRWLGLDRRSLPPAIAVVAVAVLLAVLLPLADRLVPADDPIRPGERLDLGGGVSVAAPAGWRLESGIRAGERTTVPVTPGSADAVLSTGGVVISLHLAAFGGDAAALLDAVELTGTAGVTRGARSPVTTQGGVTGLAEHFTGPGTEGLVAAYTFGAGLGLTATVLAGPGEQGPHAGAIGFVLTGVSREEQP